MAEDACDNGSQPGKNGQPGEQYIVSTVHELIL
jgi:hypothetical protein